MAGRTGRTGDTWSDPIREASGAAFWSSVWWGGVVVDGGERSVCVGGGSDGRCGLFGGSRCVGGGGEGSV